MKYPTQNQETKERYIFRARPLDETEEHGGKDAAPFQYIVTTTSRPPDDIHEAICLKLEAHPPENILFRRLLKNQEPLSTSDLFPADVAQGDL